MNRIELLAPAGDLARAKTAITYGADAVYLGGKRFSLRSRASNFSIEDIAEAVRFAKAHHARIYVTINMIPHDEDLDGLAEYVRQLADCGVAAVICSSPYIISVVHRIAPELEIHLSTQESVTNSAAIAFYQKLGVTRIVMARELALTELRILTRNSPLPLEIFIHGGMCANYSGRCTMSNYLTYRDANRGGCAHSCRWFYHLYADGQEVTAAERLFTLAATDLCAVDFIPDLIAMKACSLKIEGRMKSAYYIATVVKAYRQLIDEYYAVGTLSPERLAYYKNQLARAENRPVDRGYLDGCPQERARDALISSPAAQELVGYVKDYANGRMLMEVRNHFCLNDRLEIFTSQRADQVFTATAICDETAQPLLVCNKPMQLVWITIPFAVEVDDIVRRAG